MSAFSLVPLQRYYLRTIMEMILILSCKETKRSTAIMQTLRGGTSLPRRFEPTDIINILPCKGILCVHSCLHLLVNTKHSTAEVDGNVV